MTRSNDIPDEMRGRWLDPDTQDRMLAGRVHPDDAPPGYADVARVLRVAASSVAAGQRLPQEDEHIALALDLLSRTTLASKPSDRRSRKMGTGTRRVKLGGLIVVGTLLASTGLAAAGVLPDAAQDAFDAIFERVGITVPANDVPAGATDAPSGDEISGIATTTDATGVAKGAEISSAASNGMSQAGQHGQGSSAAAGLGSGAAPVSVPNDGGTGTAGTASGGASDVGTTEADEASGGSSALGSGNAPTEPPVPEDLPIP